MWMGERLPLVRRLSGERLDVLACDDPDAIASRRDLRRINRLMRSASVVGHQMELHRLHLAATAVRNPRRILELGAGDGTLMLRLARRFAPYWPEVQVTMLDRQNLVSAFTLNELSSLGWRARVLSVDVADWVNAVEHRRWDLAFANLFIHHFDCRAIAALFRAIAGRAGWFMACEPRRGHGPLLASRLVWLVGANKVTREDAVLSVRAGFAGHELSALWPACEGHWFSREEPAGWFSHVFVAYRVRG